MKINQLIFFPKEQEVKDRLKGLAEKHLFREITDNNLRYFYLDSFITKGKISAQQRYFNARNYLIECGVIISVFDLDKDLFFYSFELLKKNGNPFDPFKPQGKIINISYKDYLMSISENNDTSRREYITEEKAKQMWVDNYNNWLLEYYPLIKNRF